jgi:hypothetical protein
MGRTWKNITGNLRIASGVVGKIRPGGLQFVSLDKDSNLVALLLGTSSGVMVTFVYENEKSKKQIHPIDQKWVRLGTCQEFPIVLTADIDYEANSDKLIAATFGRGIYVLDNAKAVLRKRAEQRQHAATKTAGNLVEVDFTVKL